jgi:DNA-binding winged helix-turn-helix (wHTH) protein
MPSKRNYRFGPFELDVARGELLENGDPVTIQPKPFLLLTHLVKNAGRLFSTEELVDILWPDVHVSEASLSQAMSRLRNALGETPRNAVFLETVPRRGYRFRARVASEGRRAFLISGHRRFALPAGESVLGRGDESVVPIESPSVSRRHARIVITPDCAEVEDLGSKNGTFIRGQRILQATRLFDMDELRVGAIRLQFRYLTDESTVTDATDTRA